MTGVTPASSRLTANSCLFGERVGKAKQSMPITEFALANKTLYFSSCFGSGNHRSCNFISVPDMDIGYSTWQNRVTSVSYQPGETGFKTWKANHPACFQTDSH